MLSYMHCPVCEKSFEIKFGKTNKFLNANCPHCNNQVFYAIDCENEESTKTEKGE